MRKRIINGIIIFMFFVVMTISVVAIDDSDLSSYISYDNAYFDATYFLNSLDTTQRNFTIGGADSGVSGFNNQAGQYKSADSDCSKSPDWNFGIGGDFSINLWSYTNTSDGTARFLVTNRQTATDNDWFGIWHTNGAVTWRVIDSAGADSLYTAPAVSLNEWTMFTIVWNGTHVLGYLNGTLMGSNSGANHLEDSGFQLRIGCQDAGGGDTSFSNAVIDEVSFYNGTAITQTDITQLWNAGAGLFYPFNSSAGTNFTVTATDEWNGSSLNISVWIGGIKYGPNITVSTAVLSNSSNLHNVTIGATGYFNRTYLEYNVSSNLAGELHQAELCFNGTEKVSESSITPNNFTIDSTTRTECFNLSSGSYNVMAEKTGWYSKNQTFTVTPLLNTTYTVENMSYSNLTIYAIDGTTNESLSGYNLTIKSYNFSGWPGENGTGVTNYSFYLIDGYYNVTIDAPGYALNGSQANITVSGATNYTFTLYKTNSVQIYLFDEITNNPILENITVRWTSNSTTWENVTDTGSLFVSNITAGEYELLFYASNYSTRSYTITVGNRSTQTLNAYMINSVYSTIFTIKDIDTGDTLDSVSITMYKLINSTWTTVESKSSDISGKAQFYYDPIASYKFFLARSDYEDYVFFLNPILFSSYDVFMTKTTVLNYSVDFDDISIIYAPAVFFNNENTTFNYLISSPDGTLTDYSIKLTYPGGTSSASGVNAIGEQLSVWVNVSGATAFDSVTLEYNYTTTLSGERSFKTYLPIVVNETGGTWLQNKNTTYGLGLFERLLILTIIVLFAVGIATMVGQVIPGLVIGLFLFGFMVFIGFVPIWAILPSMLVGVLFVVWKSGGV